MSPLAFGAHQAGQDALPEAFALELRQRAQAIYGKPEELWRCASRNRS
jgi:hypothetical protein